MKLRLSVETGSLAGKEFELTEGFLLLGRTNDSTVKFDFESDPGVSTHHLMIQSQNGNFLLQDQQSTNGTYLNGRRVEQAYLQNGDLLTLGLQGPRIHVALESSDDSSPPLDEKKSLGTTLSTLSFFNPEKDKTRTYIGFGLALGMAAFLGLILTLVMIATLGLKGAVVGALMAFAPAPAYLLLFLWLDRYDPEPPAALVGAFAWGALFALLVSFVFNTVFGTFAATLVGGPAGDTLAAVISAPFVEEGTKGLGVILIMIFLRSEFDGILDGLVYAGIVALGFATGENVLYYGRSYVEEGSSGLLMTGFLRGVLSPFAHSLFTSMIGIGCGIARESHRKSLRILMPLAGYGLAVTLHAMWNGLAFLLGAHFFYAYFFIWIPLFLAAVSFVFYAARRERRIIKEMLAVEVSSGSLPKEHLEMLGSLLQRARWIGSTAGNLKKLKARRRYLRAVTKLGFFYWHASRASAANHETISIPQIPKYRAEVAYLSNLI
jgi:RsiW-degrading membrane proteinase PrsW (M82 family)